MEKQVTPEQVELWLNDPVTKAYMESIAYCRTAIEDKAHSGTLIDPRNNDLTCHNLAYANGRRALLIELENPFVFLGAYEKPEAANA